MHPQVHNQKTGLFEGLSATFPSSRFLLLPARASLSRAPTADLCMTYPLLRAPPEAGLFLEKKRLLADFEMLARVLGTRALASAGLRRAANGTLSAPQIAPTIPGSAAVWPAAAGPAFGRSFARAKPRTEPRPPRQRGPRPVYDIPVSHTHPAVF